MAQSLVSNEDEEDFVLIPPETPVRPLSDEDQARIIERLINSPMAVLTKIRNGY